MSPLEEAIKNLVDTAAERLRGLDVGFFNAGLQRSGAVTDFPVEQWDALFSRQPSALLPRRQALDAPPARRGRLDRADRLARRHQGRPGPDGVLRIQGRDRRLGKALAAELAPHKIRVNTVCPGWIDTPFNQPAIDFMGGRESQEEVVHHVVPLGRQGVPEEVAGGVLFLASDASSYMTGQILVIDGGVA